ncbi:GNAT family N-acetyltransferase [uncultured Sphingomonas sp.]|uniref:GNAT family N-acetyltransferase n=1 Tax=uncultured Sphingomonas sp. TaxID=158754 RepID=UPI0025E7450C|nr:GNAT family N-acetyltransferase [uncultured Sphingomonas sp.]
MTSAFDPAYGEAWNQGQCLGILSLPDTWLTFAQVEEVAVGFALNRFLVEEAELLLLAVAPEQRRQGVARALIERTAADAERRGARRLLLEVRADNEAIDLYRQAQFAEIGRRRDYYRGPSGLRDAITLARPLG